MKGRLLLSTTALLAGVTLATAQTPQQSERSGGNKSPNAAQSQIPQQRGGDAQRDQAQQKQGQNQAQQRQGQDQRQPQQAQGRDQSRSTTGQAPSDREQKGRAQQKDSQGRAGADRDQRRQDRTTGQGQQQQRDQAGQQKQQKDRDAQRGAQQKQQRDRDTQRGAQRQKQQKQQKRQTEGRAGDTDQRAGAAGRDRARGSVDLTVKQRTRIRQTVLARSNVPRVRDVDFALRVGTVVPSHVHFVAVPPVLIDIHPAWRGHRYFVVNEQIVIVSPSSREIVAVVPLGSSQASGGGAVGGAVAVDLSEAEIRQVQLVLIERGFLDGDADGVFGPNTRSALIAFQRSEGLEATGRITTRTVTALNLSDRITVRGEQRGSGREPSTIGRGNERMQQRSPRRSQDMNGERRGEQMQQPSGRQDMNGQQRGQMSPQKSKDQDRATTGQGGDQPKAGRSDMNSQMQDRATTGQDDDQAKGKRDMSPSTTGQSSRDQGAERPGASENPSKGGSSSQGASDR